MKTKAPSLLFRISKPGARVRARAILSIHAPCYHSFAISHDLPAQRQNAQYVLDQGRQSSTLTESSLKDASPPPGSTLPPEPPSPRRPQDERKVTLGKNIRFLRSRLPTLLASPLPQQILSPHISLHLFPSTHPHLPTVSGRVAYHAALWSSPVAWGRFPIIGNVKLDILDQRMVDEVGGSYGQRGREKLIVRWRTAGGPTNLAAGTTRIAQLLGRSPESKETPPPSPFHGLFIFTFDEAGRILTHTIEHSEESRDAEYATSKVFSLTDWLIKKARGHEERTPEIAWSKRGATAWHSEFP